MNVHVEGANAQAFAERALGIVNGGFLSLMLSIGHRTGLFDTLASLPTSQEIAGAARLNERYVSEWLGAMVTGGVISALLVSLLGNVETAIVDVFRLGGGVPYSAFDRFHELMAESSRTTLEATLFERTLPLVPELTDRLEGGVDLLDLGCGQGLRC